MPKPLGICLSESGQKKSTESLKSPRSQSASASSQSLEFPYAALVSDSPIKPAIPVQLHGPEDRRFPVYALPDSGADGSVFPKAWASQLGIDLEDCDKRPVNTGAGKAYHHFWDKGITATIGEKEISLRAAFGPIKVSVLGRLDFFAEFFVEFDERQRITRITPYVS